MIPFRRWFRFSRRTLFVVVTALGCWLGWELHTVRQRREMRAMVEHRGAVIYRPWPGSPLEASIGFFRRQLGDVAISIIVAQGDDWDSDFLAEVRRVFPEARVGPWR